MTTFKILHTNDVHSHIEEYFCLAKQIRQLKDENTFYFDAGDFCDFQAPEMLGSEGLFGIEILKMQGCDTMTIGNNEANGYEYLDIFTRAGLPVVSSNLRSTSNRILYSSKSIILNKNGLRFLVIGATPDGTHNDFFDLMGIHSDNAEESIQRELDVNYNQYDVCILISHLGLNRDREIAKNIKGIDIIIGGHSHSHMDTCEKIEKTYIHQAGNYAQYFGYLEFDYTEGNLTLIHAKTIENEMQPDKKNKVVYEKLKFKANELLKQPIFEINENLDLSLTEENTLTNLMADALYEQFDCDCACISSGHFMQALNKGKISRWDLLMTSPSHLNPTKIRVKGKNIRKALEMSLNKEYCASPVKGAGFRGTHIGFLCVSHMKVIYKENKIKEIYIQDKLLDDEKEYVLVTTDFLQRGSAYETLRSDIDLEYRIQMLREVLEEYLKTPANILKAKEKRWVSVSRETI